MNDYISFKRDYSEVYINISRIDFVRWIKEEWNSYVLKIFVGGSNEPFEKRCTLKELNNVLSKLNLPEVKDE
jgi:glutamine amidotransferase-like uncharacterized protein